MTHLPGRVISGTKNPLFPSLSLINQESSAIWHLNNRLVLLEKIRFVFFLYFAYGDYWNSPSSILIHDFLYDKPSESVTTR